MNRLRNHLLASAGIVVAAGALLIPLPPAATAYIEQDNFKAPTKNFDPVATLSADGRRITVTGSIGGCEPQEKTSETQVSLLQQATLASANGTAIQPCAAGEAVHFVVEAIAPESKPAFEEGPAQVCGLAVSRAGQRIADIEHWCTFITLERQ